MLSAAYRMWRESRIGTTSSSVREVPSMSGSVTRLEKYCTGRYLVLLHLFMWDADKLMGPVMHISVLQYCAWAKVEKERGLSRGVSSKEFNCPNQIKQKSASVM